MREVLLESITFIDKHDGSKSFGFKLLEKLIVPHVGD